MTVEMPAPPPGELRTAPIEFTGLGGEYFRIWIVNLLLMLVTVGIYYPWAKVRKLRYFYGHTLVDGHALDFHGNPVKMLRGTLLFGALLVLYSIASDTSPLAGGIALVVLAVIWPALFRASLQFRLANTSWRGLRFRFEGSMRDAYVVFGLPIVALVGISVLGGVLAGVGRDGDAPSVGGAGLVFALMPLLGLLVMFTLLPWFWFRLKKYQHDHYAYGPLRTELRSSAAALYGLFARTSGVSLLAFLTILVLIVVVAYIAFGGLGIFGELRGDRAAQREVFGTLVLFLPLFLIAGLLVQMAPRAYLTSRLQNLLWSRTGNRFIRFKSQLGFRAMWWQMLKNWLLVLVTLGLYWPFAAVAMARLRLQAVSLISRVDLGALAAASAAASGDAAGDAAADLLGIDLGL